MKELYTIGHSNHSMANFLSLLRQHHINVLCDVRSHPYSRYHPHFTYQSLKQQELDCLYVFLGKELGGKPKDLTCYDNDGKIHYASLAKSLLFQEGINRLKKGIESYRIALMCVEKDPADCHRAILIGRHLSSTDLMIKHILEDGRIETQTEVEQRLIKHLNVHQPGSLTNSEQLIQLAYDLQSQKIAYVLKEEESNYEQNFTLHNRLYSENRRTIF